MKLVKFKRLIEGMLRFKDAQFNNVELYFQIIKELIQIISEIATNELAEHFLKYLNIVIKITEDIPNALIFRDANHTTNMIRYDCFLNQTLIN